MRRGRNPLFRRKQRAVAQRAVILYMVSSTAALGLLISIHTSRGGPPPPPAAMARRTAGTLFATACQRASRSVSQRPGAAPGGALRTHPRARWCVPHSRQQAWGGARLRAAGACTRRRCTGRMCGVQQQWASPRQARTAQAACGAHAAAVWRACAVRGCAAQPHATQRRVGACVARVRRRRRQNVDYGGSARQPALPTSRAVGSNAPRAKRRAHLDSCAPRPPGARRRRWRRGKWRQRDGQETGGLTSRENDVAMTHT